MTPEQKEAVIACMLDVSSEFAFLMLDYLESLSAEMHTAPMLCSTLSFSGDHAGMITIQMDRNLAREVAANLLNIDEDSVMAESSAPESVNEFINVIGGHLVTILFGEEADVNLGTPQCTPTDQPLLDDTHNRLFFADGDRPVILSTSHQP